MKKIAVVSIFIVCTFFSSAQEATLSSGGNASGANGSASYSIGQTIYTTHTGTNGSSAQGVQHPYEIYVTTGIEFTEIDLSFTAYPNPATNTLNLSIENTTLDKLSYQLITSSGELVYDNTITSTLTSIDIAGLPNAIYFIRVMRDTKLIKTFKVIKH